MLYCKNCKRPFELDFNLKKHEQKCSLNEEKIQKIRSLYLEGFATRYISKLMNSDPGTIYYHIQDIARRGSEAVKACHKMNPESYRQSAKTREKISKARLKYLQENPDKVPFRLYHSSKDSWPELIFKNELERRLITGWFHNYNTGIYEYDFAFPIQKVDVEIDGPTHVTEIVKRIDKRRDEWTRIQGWDVLRFKTVHVKRDVKECVNILTEFLKNKKIDQKYVDEKFNELLLNIKTKKEQRQKEIEEKRQEKTKQIELEKNSRIQKLKEIDLSKRGWLKEASEKLKLSHSAIRRFLRLNSPDLEKQTYFKPRINCSKRYQDFANWEEYYKDK
jgi:very-short-patch-repair endonuclease